MLAGGLVWWLVGGGGGCEPTHTVRVTVAPEMGDVARPCWPIRRNWPTAAARRPRSRRRNPWGPWPTWVLDSLLWLARAPQDAQLEATRSMAVSPIVLATSRAAADALGWPDAPPSWPAAPAAAHPIAVPDPAKSAGAISALGAVRAGLGGGADADNAIVEAVLAAARGPMLTVDAALAQGSAGDAAAPLVPVSEQEVYASHAAAGDSQLVAVYPSDGSPRLDYPVIRVGSAGEDAAAVDAIVRRLTSAAAGRQARDAGFRDPDGAAPTHAADAGLQEASPQTIALDPADVRALLARLASLSATSTS